MDSRSERDRDYKIDRETNTEIDRSTEKIVT